MKSSRRLLRKLGLLALLVSTAGVIVPLRARLARTFGDVRARSDVYALPNPHQVVIASLGYRSALADLLFAHVLVWHGLNFQEKRKLDFAYEYLDTIATLDPTFRDPYYYGDTLIAIQPTKPTRDDYWRARRLLERGMAARPFDTELWLSAGQFIAYLAAPWLEDPKEQAEWRLAGARRLARACEIVGSNENIPFHCITAARLFDKAGQREAMIQFLERVLAVTDDDEIREMALGTLLRITDEKERERTEQRVQELRTAWRDDLPYVSLTKALLLSPPFDPARCAGGAEGRECATSWAAWRSAVDAESY